MFKYRMRVCHKLLNRRSFDLSCPAAETQEAADGQQTSRVSLDVFFNLIWIFASGWRVVAGVDQPPVEDGLENGHQEVGGGPVDVIDGDVVTKAQVSQHGGV